MLHQAVPNFLFRYSWTTSTSPDYLKCSSRFFEWSNSCLFDWSFLLTRASNDFMILKLLVGIRFYVTGWLMYTNVSPITLATLGRVLIDWRTVLSVVVLPSMRCVTPTKPESHNHTIPWSGSRCAKIILHYQEGDIVLALMLFEIPSPIRRYALSIYIKLQL